MKPPKLKSRDVRAIALGAALVVPALLYVWAIAPAWRALQSQRAALSAAQDTLAQERRLMMQMRTISARHDQMVAWLATEARRLFDGEDDIAATSGLAEYVTRAATQSGVTIRETETRPSIPVTGALRAVRLDIRVDGNTRSLMTFLKQIEGGNRLVRVGRLIVSRGGANVAPSITPSTTVIGLTNAIGSSHAPLSVTAEMYGYAIVPTPDSLRVASSQQGTTYRPIGNGVIESTDIGDALVHDPFSATRGEIPPSTLASTPPLPPPFPVKLVGTAVDHAGAGFAVCQLGDQPAVIVHQGEQIAGYTLRTVDRGSITLADAGGKLIHLTIPTPEA